MRKNRPRRTHLFVDDPEMRDPLTGEQYCLCGLPYGNAVHRLSGRSAEERDHEARRIGERH